jgi:hypothetical protein
MRHDRIPFPRWVLAIAAPVAGRAYLMLKSIDFGVHRLFCPDSCLANSVDGRLPCRRAAMGMPSNRVASGHFALLCRVVAEFSKSLLGLFTWAGLYGSQL